MDNVMLDNLQQAIAIIGEAGAKLVCGGPACVWIKTHHARQYLEAQIAEILAPPEDYPEVNS